MALTNFHLLFPFLTRPVARFFRGGVRASITEPNNEIINVEMTRYASSEDRAVGPTNLRTVSQMGTTFNGTGNCCERRRRKPLGGGVGGMPPPRKFSILKALKSPFPALSSQ